MNKNRVNHKIAHIAYAEMIILVCASLAFAYIVHESDSAFARAPADESNFIKFARAKIVNFFSYGLVSAEETGLWTCQQNLNGSSCQEYPAQACNGLCNGTCFPGLRRDFAECALGTCIDPAQGTCAGNTPKAACTASGARWDARAVSEIPACRPGCCIGGDQALFRTEKQCDKLRQSQPGIAFEFRPVTSELACLALARPREEGACVLSAVDEEEKHACTFTTRESCNSRGGTLYSGLLCSNAALNTSCEKQARTSCVTGKDEVYWFDSCGNRENIYDINRVKSWNAGRLLAKNESCALGLSANPLAHQAGCGNCNYLGGSVCGTQTTKDVKPSIGNYVCRDLSCVDDKGQKRKNGESWCAFESKIGVEGTGNGLRSVDVPGSESSRRVCLNGEIRTERCGNARSEVCVENRDEQVKFSSAACRANQWQLCVAANQAADGEENPEQAAQKVKDECEKYTDCALKSVDLKGGRGTFAFNVCVPRYAPGFDAQSASGVDNARELCGLATSECKYVKVKGLGSSKQYNKLCLGNTGAETMNNLCMSLGDCGASANVAGDVSDAGFKVRSSRGEPPKLSDAYKTALRTLATPARNQKVAPLTERELTELFGLQNQVGQPNSNSGQGAMLQQMAMVSGALGSLLAYGVSAGLLGGATVGTAAEIAAAWTAVLNAEWGIWVAQGWGVAGDVAAANAAAAQASQQLTALSNPGLGAYAGALAGALIGAAGVAYLLKALGISEGLPPAVTYGLIVGGAFGGGAVGFQMAAYGTKSLSFFVGWGAAGLWTLVAIVVIIAIFAILGIGKKKETKINFQCLPWQAPLGGVKCAECGKDGLPCTQYQCHSLGQACKYVENSVEGACVNAAPNDVSAPAISADASVLLSGYRYEQVSERGFVLKSSEGDGCVPRYTAIRMGIVTNELAQCKIAKVHTSSYDDMPTYFHALNGREENAFRKNHTRSFSILGAELIEAERQIDQEFDDESEEQTQHLNELFTPDQSGNVNLYVRCLDVNGNGKTSAEYAINFCASAGPDRTASSIGSFAPASPAYTAFNATQHRVNFFTNEPSECRWSATDSAYQSMTQNASCATGAADAMAQGWYCNATLPLSFSSAEQEQTFYFRCSDQPTKNESERNINQQSISYVVKKTLTPLRIARVEPNNASIVTNGLPVSVDLKVSTADGAPNTIRRCEFKFGDRFIQFLETGTDQHRQPNLRFFNIGAYTIPIRCNDDAGNSAEGISQFNVSVDSTGPRITRVYNRNGLVIVTNEAARCAFSLSSCSFSFVNGTLMQGDARVHTISFSGDVAHYIICKDRFENPSACIAVRKGGL